MIIKINRKEALRVFKWRTRRKIKKHEKLKKKNPCYRDEWGAFLDDTDKFLAFGDNKK